MWRMVRLILCATLGTAGWASGQPRAVAQQDAPATQDATAERSVKFDQVSQILSRHCLSCHNEIDREGDFSLQTSDSLMESGYVEAGDRSSHLLSVVGGGDGEAATMPKDAEPLTEQQIDLLSEWIAAGAVWPEGVEINETPTDFDWWSLQPIQRPPIPDVPSPDVPVPDVPGLDGTGDRWTRTPIDSFVLRKLRAEGLSPSIEADRRTLIRRVTYDLTGLPPTPEQIDAFTCDSDPRAYERLVERLLASVQYGQRWARHWLDVVKYADTCGYDKDKLRPHAWPYRDYVVRSFNQDKPYARFIKEQIAGDVLYPGEPDGILGLGFLAAGPWDFIGHVEVPETKIDGKVARNLDRDEMVSNTLNTFCSVTIQCARCHNHKFDPFTQEHYYSLQAVFSAVDRANRPYDIDPEIEERRIRLQSSLKRAKQQQQQIEAKIAAEAGTELAKLDQQIESLTKSLTIDKAPAFGFHSAISDAQDVTKWVQVYLGREVAISKIVLRPCHDEFGGIGAGFGFPVRYRVDVGKVDPSQFANDSSRNDRATCVADESTADVSNPGLAPQEIAVHSEPARYVRVTATRLAPRSGDFIFALAELQIFDTDGNEVSRGAAVTALDSIEAPVRWGRKNLTDGVWASSSDPDASRQVASLRRKRDALLAKARTQSRRQRLEQLKETIDRDQEKLESLPSGRLVHAAATDFEPQGNFKPTRGKPRTVYLLRRGDVQQPLREVAPGRLPLHADDHWNMDPQAEEGARRAALARWLADSENPLVWRSIVNRIWQYHFGTGLVETPNDFGRMGSKPTHPELLDWLATEFRNSGQSFKRLHRLIVTSGVYRQASTFDARKAEIDGSNRYLWRMNRRRLEAEEIRDSILKVSGRLDASMGGPGFYLFELEKTAHSPHYQYHKFDPSDPESHRRSIYRFVVRSQPDPFMTTLDCADSSQSTPRRNETLTSLQALSLLNNRFNLEMAQRFASRLRREDATTPERVARAMRLITGRRPSDQEQGELVSYADQHGLENLCRLMFNFSEFLFLD